MLCITTRCLAEATKPSSIIWVDNSPVRINHGAFTFRMWVLAMALALGVSIRKPRLEDANGIVAMLTASAASSSNYGPDQIQACCELLPSVDRIQEIIQEDDRISWLVVPIYTAGNERGDASSTFADETTTTVAGYID